MNRRFYFIFRAKRFSKKFSVHFSINNDSASLPAKHRSVNSDSINENKHLQYKNSTFEDITRNNDQYT